ncbi:hypothetical protein [Paraburkholderia sp. MM6662-R1]|uniref:hypothetical protein n=1 Tax=Paraburkholderia sp. MM6662-R1 TaxID=2991066 RepID=UPI003D1BCBAC
MRYQDFDELEFTRYDDEDEMRRYAEEQERSEEEERKRKRDRDQAMLDEEREREEEDYWRRRQEERQWSDDCGTEAETARDPEEEARIRKRNELIVRFSRYAGLVGLGALLGVVTASAAVYAGNR